MLPTISQGTAQLPPPGGLVAPRAGDLPSRGQLWVAKGSADLSVSE